MNKTTFLVDGFNLYHGLVDAQRDGHGSGTKWLDLKKLCSSYLRCQLSDPLVLGDGTEIRKPETW